MVPLYHAQKPLLSANTRKHLKLLIVNMTMSEDIKSFSREKNLHKYQDVFEGLGCLKGEYHIQIQLKLKIATMVKYCILAKAIEPIDWISSLLVVQKQNKLMICIDPKDLNRAIKCPNYQMPTIEEVLPCPRKAKVYSVLDAKDEFYYVKLNTASSYLTTVWTPFGRYQYKHLFLAYHQRPKSSRGDSMKL